MKLFLALAALATAVFATSCASNDEDVERPAESEVWRIAPGKP